MQAKAFIGEEHSNKWTAGVLRLSRWEVETSVSRSTGQAEVITTDVSQQVLLTRTVNSVEWERE